MTAPLTAELLARAIIASAISYRDPLKAATVERGPARRCMAPAAIGAHDVVGGSLERIASILGLSIRNLYALRNSPGADFTKARAAAAEAVRYHLRSLELDAAAPAQPQADVLEFEPETNTSDQRVEDSAEIEHVALAPRPAKPAASPGRALPRGARFVNLGDGVQRIVTKPIPERVARMAAQQLARGADINFVADCFDATPEALQAAVDALKQGEAA